jgi:hypothetical protein
MKLTNWLLGGTFVMSFLILCSLLNNPDERAVMCEIQQNGNLHVMPCRLVASYLAEVTL